MIIIIDRGLDLQLAIFEMFVKAVLDPTVIEELICLIFIASSCDL